MDFTIAIPARFDSKRLPGKVLADLCGKPVLRHVWDNANRVHSVGEVVVLTESEMVRDAVQSWGGRCLMTPAACSTGTERIAWALEKIPGDYVINLQADEPFLRPATIAALIDGQLKIGSVDEVRTPIYAIRRREELLDPNVVKVVCGNGGEALYFSRSPIPHIRDCPEDGWIDRGLHFGHIGVYLYGRNILEEWHSLPKSQLAEAESLEQLRLLQAGRKIFTVRVDSPSLAIDTAADLNRAREIILEGADGVCSNG
ncbi:MAG: 3-deoxy-manno-octulosonate cytidylyltransferase [Puniceicoccales bacterium]|nr:3-deoxy-manno-octulosonate cytidylyltransferase [Puniceicoccales bacterium]